MRGNSKRGLSAVITSLIIILLVLVAVGIVWVIVKNLIDTSTEDVSLDKYTVNIKINGLDIVDDNNIAITLQRNPGKGNIKGVLFIFQNGTDSEKIENFTTFNELQKMNYNLNPRMNASEITSISIAYMYEGGVGEVVDVCYIVNGACSGTGCRTNSDCSNGNVCDGNEICSGGSCKPGTPITCDTGYSCSPSAGCVFFISDIVSWWRFEGDAQDEMNNYDGTLVGDVDCTVPGKFGQACIFNKSGWGSASTVNTGDIKELANSTAFTVSMWYKGEAGNLFSKQHYTGQYSNIQADIDILDNTIEFHVGEKDYGLDLFWDNSAIWKNYAYNANEWEHIAFVFNGSGASESEKIKIYLNGAEGNLEYFYQSNDLSMAIDLTDKDFLIGRSTMAMQVPPWEYYNNYQGSIDEVMVFDKALTQSEVTSLYNLNLS